MSWSGFGSSARLKRAIATNCRRKRKVLNLAPPPDATVKPVKFTSSNLFFKRYRQGLADIISPSYPPNPLPEMCCFDPGKCCCVYYETGDSKESSSSDSLELGGFLDHRSRGPYGTKCFAYHTRYNSHGFGRNGDVIKIWFSPRYLLSSMLAITVMAQSRILMQPAFRVCKNCGMYSLALLASHAVSGFKPVHEPGLMSFATWKTFGHWLGLGGHTIGAAFTGRKPAAWLLSSHPTQIPKLGRLRAISASNMRITPAMILLSSFRNPSDSIAKGLTVELFNDPWCSGGKFQGWYTEGICYSTQGNRGMHIINARHFACHLTVFSGDSCSSDDRADLDTRKCWEVGSRGSFRISC
ncbi:hypothetical protein B0T10DRAFT_548663 [Thelonectria olida]|uniref:Uncharacterized protein n=1 Tax=Thelonectria olida TaxID=1576542 RepID=A0A9P8W3Y4_9HYPO|nr:hypothetical protein B0T10DRAFT_548663 [Thelonectria olida]